ncbi:cytochrome P450 [Crassisporium funariophilum]|nr:cytochrome P450 [Crassisporium funariophilum]
MYNLISVLSVILALLAISLGYRLGQFGHSTKLPPGPRQGLLSNSKGPATTAPWKTFTMLHKAYGPVISFYLGKTPIIAATDLLEKRGSIYSSRPRNIMAGEILSGGMRGLAMPYGTRWRNWRSLMVAGMGVEACRQYKSLQDVESRILLHDLLSEEDNKRHTSHLRRFAISVVNCAAYGRRIKSLDHPLILANQKTDEYYVSLLVPGKYIVETWPILLYLPRSLQWFRREPEVQRKKDTDMYMKLMQDVRHQMEAGTAQHSTARRGLEKQADFGLNDVEMAFALSAPFQAGVGTTLATLEVFLLAMLHYPHTMRKAQAELDLVVGTDRMPDFDDVDSLPYTRALIKETMRWRPIAPTGVPHSVISEDEYEGMSIPKGSTVYANIYAMSKDEQMFPSSDEFKPERYMGADDPNSKGSSPNQTFFFGFGRRICPGMHVAQNSIFIVISRILWAFEIMPPRNENGDPVLPPTDDFIGGLVVRPRPFSYSFVSRSAHSRSLIEQEFAKADVEALAWM